MGKEKTSRNKTDISQYDFEKEAEKITKIPGTLAFPHSLSSALIKPEDKGKIKGRAVAAMHEQTDRQLHQIFEQMQLLAKQAQALKDRVSVSERIYMAQMNFEPLISHTYHLYQKQDGTDVLSMIAPDEWGRSLPYARWIATVKLLADHTWEVLSEDYGD